MGCCMMYKRNIRVCLLVFVFVLISNFVVSAPEQPNPEEQPLPSAVSGQQVADLVHQVMQEQKKEIVKDINSHMDENFGQLDKRILDNNKLLFRKAIFAILGGMTVILIGYAYLVNRVTKQYDMSFYEKLIESKMKMLNKKLPGHLYINDLYNPVTYDNERIKERFDTPERYFDGLTKEEIQRDEFSKMKQELLSEVKNIVLPVMSQKKSVVKSHISEREVKPLPKSLQKINFLSKFKFDKKKLLYILGVIVVLGLTVYYFYWKYLKPVGVGA